MKIKWVKQCNCIVCELTRREQRSMCQAMLKAIDHDMMHLGRKISKGAVSELVKEKKK